MRTFDESVDHLIALRAEARANKDYAFADEIRDILLEYNIRLLDERDKT